MAYTTINKPSDYFNTKLYTGTGSSNSVTGIGFQPDLVWIKNRSGSYWHNLTDSVRGVTKVLYSHENSAETTTSNYVSSFNTDGFTVSTDSDVNGNGNSIVAWNWLGANGTASNTDGSITSTVSANTTNGFSIVSYTGTGANATVGHGLGSAPKMVITKSRDTNGLDWRTYHASLGATKFVVLNLTDASTTASNFMNDTEPTSSVFSLGSGTTPNKSGDNYIAYCFSEVKGFSKFGSYTGNNSNDGTFVYTGFKPAFVLIKRYDAAASWFMFDSKRDPSNGVTQSLIPNLSNAEGTNTTPPLDFLSNGFKLRYAHPNFNTGSYIYMAFAEAPLVGSNGVTAKAR